MHDNYPRRLRTIADEMETETKQPKLKKFAIDYSDGSTVKHVQIEAARADISSVGLRLYRTDDGTGGIIAAFTNWHAIQEIAA